jgi:hypothetical protein
VLGTHNHLSLGGTHSSYRLHSLSAIGSAPHQGDSYCYDLQLLMCWLPKTALPKVRTEKVEHICRQPAHSTTSSATMLTRLGCLAL